MVAASQDRLPPGFVFVDDACPGIAVDPRYAGPDNFTGAPLDGYLTGRLALTQPAARALAAADAALHSSGLRLVVVDAYRPQRAVDGLVRWAETGAADSATEAQNCRRYYPHLPRQTLFDAGFLARRSAHSRGSTVDVVLAAADDPSALVEMGTEFDYFGPESAPDYLELPPAVHAHRRLLTAAMAAAGFVGHPHEWWHFTLDNEPYPDTYFDFVV